MFGKKMFQSSPTPKGGCDMMGAYPNPRIDVFQSSPTPKGGCDWSSARLMTGTPAEFQSSPTPKGGCDQAVVVLALRLIVSILTHPEGRVRLRRL